VLHNVTAQLQSPIGIDVCWGN